ncbi:MAG: nucleotide exchange factor GrpE [Parvularculaceae bacterium]
MTDKDDINDDPSDADGQHAQKAASDNDAETDAVDEDDDVELDRETLEASAAELMAEVETLQDRVLRLNAELENTRRRAEREKADAGRYAIANFARDLLSVADNFERAIAAAPEAAEDEATSSLLTGVRMTEKELLAAFSRHGVKRIETDGSKFDPNLHQAVAQAPAAGVPAGHIAQTAQTGFILGERVLRAAMVVVSTGEPEAPPMATREPPVVAEPQDGAANDSEDGDETGPGARVDTSA